jgi:hypothetical protein
VPAPPKKIEVEEDPFADLLADQVTPFDANNLFEQPKEQQS